MALTIAYIFESESKNPKPSFDFDTTYRLLAYYSHVGKVLSYLEVLVK